MAVPMKLTRFWVAVFCVWQLASPGAAFLPPDLYLRRTQLVQLLPYSEVDKLQQWVAQQPLLLSPHDYFERLGQESKRTSVAWTFYAGWCYLEVLEHTLRAYDQRGRDLDDATDLLSEYQDRANDRLRVRIEPGTPRVLTLAEPKSQPTVEKTDDYLQVFRPLPWPESYDRAQVIELLEACRADLAQVDQQRSKLQEARARFLVHHSLWTDWLSDLAEASQKFTQAEYLQPFGDPLPLPPAEPPPVSPEESL